jgi:hypothetical protein
LAIWTAPFTGLAIDNMEKDRSTAPQRKKEDIHPSVLVLTGLATLAVPSFINQFLFLG